MKTPLGFFTALAACIVFDGACFVVSVCGHTASKSVRRVRRRVCVKFYRIVDEWSWMAPVKPGARNGFIL